MHRIILILAIIFYAVDISAQRFNGNWAEMFTVDSNTVVIINDIDSARLKKKITQHETRIIRKWQRANRILGKDSLYNILKHSKTFYLPRYDVAKYNKDTVWLSGKNVDVNSVIIYHKMFKVGDFARYVHYQNLRKPNNCEYDIPQVSDVYKPNVISSNIRWLSALQKTVFSINRYKESVMNQYCAVNFFYYRPFDGKLEKCYCNFW